MEQDNISTKTGGQHVHKKKKKGKDEEEEMSEEHKLLNFRKVFFEVCFLQKITPHDAVAYENFLIKRKKDVEEVVKSHFTLLHETLRGLLRDALDKRRLKREK